MKARKVKGLDPEGTLADNLERIVLARCDELHAFMPKAADPDEVRALHDMRIAAKRLRYILEMSEGCFGPYAATAAKRAKELQDLLGEIHDCDVTIPRVRAQLRAARAEDVAAALAAAEGDADLDPRLSATGPNASAYRGLETLLVHLRARRSLLFGRFLDGWDTLGREGFRARLEFAVGERPETSRSQDVNGRVPDEALPSAPDG